MAEETNIVKVQYYSATTGDFSKREYTYYSEDKLKVGDIAIVPVRDTTDKAMVTAINVPIEKIAGFKDKVKTIPAGSKVEGTVTKVRPEQQEMEDGLNSEGFTLVREIGEPFDGIDTKINLCDTCQQSLPECVNNEVSFGDGVGKDNVIKCDGYTPTIEDGLNNVETAVVKINPTSVPSFSKHLDAAFRILEIARARTITTEDDAKSANDDLTVMSELRKAVEAERKTFTGPLNDYVSSINAAYKEITNPLIDADQITRKTLTDWKVLQLRKSKEVEELNRKALEVAQEQARLNNGEFTADITPVTIPETPRLTRTDQGTTGLVDNWKYRIVDIDKLPREYMIEDTAMLTTIAKKHHDMKQIPGVEFYNEQTVKVYKSRG